jgi:hypothetical protein
MLYLILAALIWLVSFLAVVYLDYVDYGKWYLIFKWDGYKYLQLFNWLHRDSRYWGYHEEWCHGPWVSFGFYFFNVAWCFR